MTKGKPESENTASTFWNLRVELGLSENSEAVRTVREAGLWNVMQGGAVSDRRHCPAPSPSTVHGHCPLPTATAHGHCPWREHGGQRGSASEAARGGAGG